MGSILPFGTFHSFVGARVIATSYTDGSGNQPIFPRVTTLKGQEIAREYRVSTGTNQWQRRKIEGQA